MALSQVSLQQGVGHGRYARYKVRSFLGLVARRKPPFATLYPALRIMFLPCGRPPKFKSKKFTRVESIGFDEVCAVSLKPILTLARIVVLRSAMEDPALLVLRYNQGTGEFKLGVFLYIGSSV